MKILLGMYQRDGGDLVIESNSVSPTTAHHFGGRPQGQPGNLGHGKTVSLKSPKDAERAGIGYLSEDLKHFGLATGMNVRDTIALASMDLFTGAGGVLNDGEVSPPQKAISSNRAYVPRLMCRKRPRVWF